MIGRRMRPGATRTITDGPRTGQRVTLLRRSAIEPGYWTAEAPNGASIRVHPDQVRR